MRSVSFNFDSSLLATGSDDFNINIWAVASSSVLFTLSAQIKLIG